MNDNMIDVFDKSADIERLMLCTPFINDDSCTYENKLTPELFFDTLYVPCKNNTNSSDEPTGEEKQNELKEKLERESKRTFLIVGSKGCGKTTFIHFLLNEVRKDINVETRELDFGQIRSTMFGNPIKTIMADAIYAEFKAMARNGKIKVFIDLCNEQEDLIDSAWDSNGVLYELVSSYNELYKERTCSALDIVKKNTRKYLEKMELFQLFFVYTLQSVSNQIVDGKLRRTIFVFDNMDAINEINYIANLLTEYDNFQTGISRFLRNLKQYRNDEAQYIFVFVMRELTKAHLTAHERGVWEVITQQYDVTDMYDRAMITDKRLQLYIRMTPEKYRSKDKEFAEKLRVLLQDKYINKKIFAIYNNDYRTCVTQLLTLCRRNNVLLSEYCAIMSMNDFNIRHGARGMIFRMIFNELQRKSYLTRIKVLDLRNPGSMSSSLPRLVLTYLSNCSDISCVDEGRSVQLSELLQAFDDSDPKEILDCIWEMYELIDAPEWGHLITFSKTVQAKKERLYKELDAVMKGNNDDFSEFRITVAGKLYLSDICTHFEFFACRICRVGLCNQPLFSSKSWDKNEDGKFNFQITMSNVFEQVKLCCARLNKNLEGVGRKCEKFDSEFNYRNDNGVCQYHSERIIFSHIQYIETYRHYLLVKKPIENIEDASLYIIGKISEYVKLFEDSDSAKCSKTNRKEKIKANLTVALGKPLDNEIWIKSE